MRGFAIALLSIALLLQATFVPATPVGFLQHRHTPRKAPEPRTLAPRAPATATPPTTLEVGAGAPTLEGRTADDPSKKKKKNGGVQVGGAVVVINNPNGPPKPKENCDEKSFFKKIWCKMTN